MTGVIVHVPRSSSLDEDSPKIPHEDWIVMKKALTLLAALTLMACSKPEAKPPQQLDLRASETATYTVVPIADVQWEKLNPARGDSSPKAGTLWGDRKADVATGFLAEFVEGFSSPPHIHNVTYRAVVIEGLVHNDDPAAANMWMPPGSFWTQPKGEAHITSAKAKKNIAYVEIDSGPYLVKPTEEAFDSGERPINVDPSNIVWANLAESPFAHTTGDNPKLKASEIARLWEDENNRGFMVKLSPGFDGKLYSPGADMRVVVVTGTFSHGSAEGAPRKELAPGSYFGSSGKALHSIACTSDEECTAYIRAGEQFKFVGN